MKYLMAVLCVFVLMAAPVAAQNVPNPTAYEFEPSADHAAIDSYELGVYTAVSDILIATLVIGKPTVDADGKCRGSLNVQPIKFGTYVAKVRAKAAEVFSPWSDPSNLWDREPGKPGKIVIK